MNQSVTHKHIFFDTPGPIAESLQSQINDFMGEDLGGTVKDINLQLTPHERGIQVSCMLSYATPQEGREITDETIIDHLLENGNWEDGGYIGEGVTFDQGDWYFDASTNILYRMFTGKLTRTQLNTI